MLSVEDWGTIPYREAWDRQKILFNNLIAKPHSDEYIVMCEHYPVYTLGFHGNKNNLIADANRLAEIGAECVRIERGGDITFHGPGQLVVYPIINLHLHKLGVKKYIELLESCVIKFLQHFGIRATSNNESIGVWLDWGNPAARKICAIGVKISHGISMHGAALNINTDLNAFKLINPCGIIDKGVTSLKQELGYELDMNEMKSIMSKILLDSLRNKNC